MGHSLKTYKSIDRFRLGYPYKSKRGRAAMMARYYRHAYRQHNHIQDQLHYLPFTKDIHFKRVQKKEKRARKTGYLYGNKYTIEDHLNDRFLNAKEKLMSEKGRLQVQIRKLLKSQSYNENYRMTRSSVRRKSDLCIAAYKQLKRRGEMKPFKGHRLPGQLYKRQLFF